MHNIIELEDKSEWAELQNRLNESNLSMYSLPLRQQLWYLQQNIITDGRVYVDRWPSFEYVCSLHTSKQLTRDEQFDFDVATFFQMNENVDKIENDDFESFLRALASKREWTNGRSFLANYVQLPYLDKFRLVLDKCGRFEIYGALRMYTGLERENADEYKNILKELSNRLPEELEPDVLRQQDIDKVIRNWSYAPRSVVADYFRWLLKTFPSTCLRNRRKNNELVSWACSYSCGSMANLFIEEEYRGCGLSKYLWLSIATKLSDFSPLQQFFAILPENTISRISSEKAFCLDHKTGHKLATWFFFYNRNQFPDTT